MSPGGEALLQISFEASVIYWRGPAPFFYAPIPAEHVEEVRRAARIATYGWGCVPVEAEVGGVAFTTALFPKDGTYLLPLKVAVRRKANITAGDLIVADMTIRAPQRAGGQWSPV
ncbi:MAG TPA: DUF1905 domain-containing protein [Caulobacteraceae bacterium]|nr:DUF1905 domain-containing protein [Caulobacteraceae bacterium]